MNHRVSPTLKQGSELRCKFLYIDFQLGACPCAVQDLFF